MLNFLALLVFAVILVGATVAVVFLGSLPGNIARRRDHPHPDAVTAASWIGLATGFLWPFAFIWAFLPVPIAREGSNRSTGNNSDELKQLRQRLEELEHAIATLRSSSFDSGKKGGNA